VTQTETATTEPQTLSRSARLAWLLLILATLYICYFHNLGAIGLVGPDEPRYAWIARAMAESGDWITPRLYGKPWFEKPVLYYWGAAATFKLFGVSEVTARLPSAISALLATLALAWLALCLYGAETARWLLLLLPTTVGMIGFSHAAATDMPFAAMLTIAMVFAARLVGLVPILATEVNEVKEIKEVDEVKDPEQSIRRSQTAFATGTSSSFTSFNSSTSYTSFFFGFFLGLATLAKGPAAIILSGGAVLLWAIFTKRWRDAFRCLHPAAIASFCLTALPWYILCALRNPDFFRVFIIEHNFKRYLTPEFQHIQPFWFYVPILLIAFVPWTLLLLWSAIYGSLRSWRGRRISPQTIFLLGWSLFCMVFFSTSQSKLPGYILPAVPPVATLLATSYETFSREKLFRRTVLGWSLLLLLLSLLLLWAGKDFRTSRTSGKVIFFAGAILLLFAVANLLLSLQRVTGALALRPGSLCVLPVLVIAMLFQTFSSPWFRWDLSGKSLAADIQAHNVPLDRLYVGTMPRGQQFSLNFYLRYEVQNWSVEVPREGYLLLGSKACHLSAPWVCSGEPVALEHHRWFLYEIKRENETPH
jgi:4-amino-4-deoxy-L-arabinose transferase-like glycosyltransferase